MNGSIAYAAQQAWMRNATVEKNITFGQDLDKDTYEKILDACALRTDLDILPGGDQVPSGDPM